MLRAASQQGDVHSFLSSPLKENSILRQRSRTPSSRSNHRFLRPTLEPLEDRTLLSGNLLITAEVPGTSSYNLKTYTPAGLQLSSRPVPQGSGDIVSQVVRGLTVDPSG